MPVEYILELRNCCKSYSGLKALVSVDFELIEGEILGLVGDNAAGKSTLMKIISGAYQADEGKIFFKGREVVISNPHISKQLGIEMIYQNLELCPDLNVPANLFLGRELTTWRHTGILKTKLMEKHTVDILRRLRIYIDNPRKRVDELSGGQQQAVAIGRAVSFSPKIVIMDEPTANLAQIEIDKVLDLVLALKENGISIILISHRLDDVFRVADRIFVLKHGRKASIREISRTNKDEILKDMFM